ncbi:unnamed protein product [Periconia digitata]|uniref:Uncharacterized protein n=1 Tax=Periconia digitata TaxID=1303443 RepID=A0A9W4UNH9_9PLEO|nr:unnamed protein product [Periconia digitata]
MHKVRPATWTSGFNAYTVDVHLQIAEVIPPNLTCKMARIYAWPVLRICAMIHISLGFSQSWGEYMTSRDLETHHGAFSYARTGRL